MNMGVGHLISRNEETDALRGKCCLLGFRNVMGYRKEVLGKVGVKVDPMVDFSNWNHEGMAV